MSFDWKKALLFGGSASSKEAAIASVGGSDIVGAAIKDKAGEKAQKEQLAAAQQGINEQRAARESFDERTQPFADVGLSTVERIQGLLGINTLPQPQGEVGFNVPQAHDIGPSETPPNQLDVQLSSLLGLSGNTQNQIDEINPVLSILRDEGFSDIQEAAAARGSLGAGGTLKDLTRFNTNLATTLVPQLQQQKIGNLLNLRQLENQEQQTEFGNLFNLLGLGANVSVGQGTAGMQTAGNISNLLGDIGSINANRAIGSANTVLEGIEGLSGTLGSVAGGGGPNVGTLFKSFRGGA